MKKNVLGVKIDDIDIDQSLQIVACWLLSSGKHYIVTPNPELIMMAQNDQGLKKIINNADLAIPDGVGLKLSGDIVCHTPGIELMERLIKLVNEKGYTTGFLGGKEGIAKKTAECLKRKYPNLKITLAESGGQVDKDGNNIEYDVLTNSICSIPHTDILFVAFGQPKQEKWIDRNLDKIPVRIAMTVGGSFDYIAGFIPRSPVWIRKIGCEWLFRLIIQPWRIKRQLTLVKFVFMLLQRSFT